MIGDLIALRYKLMWAKTRSRNGRIALFFAGYLLLIVAWPRSAGRRAASAPGIVAVRSGNAESWWRESC